MRDYKYEMQISSECLVEERYGEDVDFYDLGEDEKYNIFREAEENWASDRATAAEDLYDRLTGN
jgi:hypothetical protein